MTHSAPEIVVHRSADALAAGAAARLIGLIADLQSQGRIPSIVLTGGGVGIATLQQVTASPARDSIDWTLIEIYWGDERFVPQADPERNAGQARAALLDHVNVDPARVHEMAASDGEFGDDVDAAARAYADLLPASFDVVMLGMGPEGHVLSVFPDSPAVRDTEHRVVAVRDCPKPPPTRVSLTLSEASRAAEVWLLVAGAEKAAAVAAAVTGARPVDVPAAGARGVDATWFLLDEPAAAGLS